MAGTKTTPRQKLINMMYLVLTALLALNISKEILDSFITLDTSQLNSRHSSEGELNELMGFFAVNAENHPAKFEGPYEKASRIEAIASELVHHIDLIKATCIAETEGLEMDEVYDPAMDTVLSVQHIERKDNYVAVTNILYGTEQSADTEPRAGDPANFRATALRERIKAFEAEVSEQTGDKSLDLTMAELFDFSPREDADGVLQPWEHINFYDVPLAATQTLLSKMQSDIRRVELQAVKGLFDEVEGKTMKFTRLTDAVIPVTTEVSQGGRFQAEVFLAAYDDTNPPEIRLASPEAYVDTNQMEIVGDYELLPIDDNMMGAVDIPASGIGAKHREGLIIFKPAGLPEVRKRFVLDYQVSAPTAMVNPTNMNVLYKGVDNPISVGVPGYRPEDIHASISTGSLSPSGQGKYIAKVTSGQTAQVNLSVDLPDGTRRSLAPVQFRLKSVPDPRAIFGGKTAKDSRISKADLRAARGLRVEIENFLFPVIFNVVSYDVTAVVRGQPITWPSNGPSLSNNQNALLDEVRSGARVDIQNIIVRGPDGRPRKIGGISLRVN